MQVRGRETERHLKDLPAIAVNDTTALEALLPDRWVAARAEHRLEQQEEESREAQAGRRRKRAARRLAVAREAIVILNLRPE